MVKNITLSDNDPFYSVLSTPNALPFLREETRDLLIKHFAESSGGRGTLDNEQMAPIWKNLIIDSIHFLRINDCRERAFLVQQSTWTKSNKTSMSTPGSSDMAPFSAYGIEELDSYFQQFTMFESILYGVDQSYRDHLHHPIKVWVIGLHVLQEFGDLFHFNVADKIVKIEKSDAANPEWDSFDNEKDGQKRANQELRISTAELLAMWTIIALTHDLGYPLEKVERVNEQLERMLNKFGKIGFTRSSFSFQSQHDYLVKVLLTVMSSRLKARESRGAQVTNEWMTHLRPKYLTKFSKSWEMFQHGIVSSLILFKSLTFFLETETSTDDHAFLSDEDARQYAVRAEILHSIAAHTTAKIYHLSANNLSFLLFLCDELQEWGRPNLADMRARGKGGADSIVMIKQCKITASGSDIHCIVQHRQMLDHQSQEKYARKVFKGLYERLRPAVNDKLRKMKMHWNINFACESGPESVWTFKLETGEAVFPSIIFEGPEGPGTTKNAPYRIYG